MIKHFFRCLSVCIVVTWLPVRANCDQPVNSAADTVSDRIDAYVRGSLQRSHTPGVSVAVVRDGKVILAKGYGLANIELGVDATKQTVYELLSVSKQFTAAAVLILVEEGKISLDEKIGTYLPDMPASWGMVNVRHLLSHTSGIMDYTDIRPFFETIREDTTPIELLKPVKMRPLMFAPGTQWRYSNSNYYLLGQLIEKISGKPFEAFLTGRIFQPLGMTATRMEDMRDVIPNRASGYHWLDENADKMPVAVSGYHGAKNILQNAIYISPTRKWAAGAFLSTVEDLAKWDASLYTEQLLKKATLQQMWTPAKLNSGAEVSYGLGNELLNVRGHHLAGHQGGGMAFNATLLRAVDDKLTVIVLANQTSAPSKPMALKIASFFVPELSTEQNKPIQDQQPATTAMLRQVLMDAQQGKAVASQFAPEAQQLVQFVQRIGPDFLGKRGAMKAFELLEHRAEGARQVYRYRSMFGTTPLQWTFVLNENGKILSLEPSEE